MKILRIYDNGGKTVDRYTVYFNVRHAPGKRVVWNQSYLTCLSMSENPFSPQGFCRHGQGQLGSHNGKRITLEDLPKNYLIAIINDFNL